MSFEPSWKLSLFCLSIVPLQPAFDDRLRWTRRGFAVGAFSAVHLEATHVEPSHVLVTLFRTIRVAGKTRLQGTRCRTVLITSGVLWAFTYLLPDTAAVEAVIK